MKFVALREIRNHPKAVLDQLKREKEIILTSHGKPVALVADLGEKTFEEDLARYRQSPGRNASPGTMEASSLYATEESNTLRAWIHEAEQRREEYTAGKTKLIPASKVFAKLRNKFK